MDINSILFQAHSGIRWLVMLALLFVVLRFVVGLTTKSDYDPLAENLLMGFVAVLTLQWVLGAVYFLVSGLTAGNLLDGAPHLLVMTAAVGVSHTMRGRWTDKSDAIRYRNELLLTLGVALAVFVGVLLLPGGIIRWIGQ